METNILQYEIIQGIKIIEDKLLIPDIKSVQFRFPKTKKKRIRLKWFKNKSNWKTVEEERFIKYGDTVIVSTKSYNNLKSLIK